MVLEAALEHRAFRLLTRVESRLREDVKKGRTSSEAWNRALIEVRRQSHVIAACHQQHALLAVNLSLRDVESGAPVKKFQTADKHQGKLNLGWFHMSLFDVRSVI